MSEGSPLLSQSQIEIARQLFLDEMVTRLIEGKKALERLRENGTDKEALAILYKLAHTLKGSSDMVGLREISFPAVELNTVLLLAIDYGLPWKKDIHEYAARKLAEIAKQVTVYRKGDAYSVKSDGKELESRRVLIVDDDPAITSIVKSGLESKGFLVTISNNTADAYNLFLLENPDLIILDIVFPEGADGIDFCQRLRANHLGKVVPIIFLSVKGRLQDRLAGLACGADDYISKPFEMEELIARITAIFNRMENYEDLIYQDDLTGCFNRRYLNQRLQEEINQAKEENGKFALAMIDLCNFKEINDHYGHHIGDSVLQFFVNIATENLRESDCICRYGGDEFYIIMPGISREGGKKVVERIAVNLDNVPYMVNNNKRIELIFSAGITGFPISGNTVKDLLLAADEAMYLAKNSDEQTIVAG